METNQKQITPEQLAEWRELCEKATPGPWKGSSKGEVGPISREDDQSYGMMLSFADVFGENQDSDTRFIAASRTILPLLLDEVERLGKCFTQAQQAWSGLYLDSGGMLWSDELGYCGELLPDLAEELMRREQ